MKDEIIQLAARIAETLSMDLDATQKWVTKMHQDFKIIESERAKKILEEYRQSHDDLDMANYIADQSDENPADEENVENLWNQFFGTLYEEVGLPLATYLDEHPDQNTDFKDLEARN